MPVIFDYTCGKCGGEFEALTTNVKTYPSHCKLCDNDGEKPFTRLAAGPAIIEGDTPGSKPRPLKEAYNTPREMLQGHNDR